MSLLSQSIKTRSDEDDDDDDNNNNNNNNNNNDNGQRIVVKGPDDLADWSRCLTHLCNEFQASPAVLNVTIEDDKTHASPFAIMCTLPVNIVLSSYERTASQRVSWVASCLRSPLSWYLHFCAFLHWRVVELQTPDTPRYLSFPWSRHVRPSYHPTSVTDTLFRHQLEQCEYVTHFPEQTVIVASKYLECISRHTFVPELTTVAPPSSTSTNQSTPVSQPMNIFQDYLKAVRALIENYQIHKTPSVSLKCLGIMWNTPLRTWNVFYHENEEFRSLDQITAEWVVVQNVSQSDEGACILCPKDTLYKHVGTVEYFGTQYVTLWTLGLNQAIVPARTWWSFLDAWYSNLRLIRVASMHCLYDDESVQVDCNTKCPSHLWVYRIVCAL
jgi:hypothetical protein